MTSDLVSRLIPLYSPSPARLEVLAPLLSVESAFVSSQRVSLKPNSVNVALVDADCRNSHCDFRLGANSFSFFG